MTDGSIEQQKEPPAPTSQGPTSSISGTRQGSRLGGRVFRSVHAVGMREKAHLQRELALALGLMPLLMKRRNGQKWSPEERRQLTRQLRGLYHVSPYLVVMLLPGSFVLLPALAWWLDRRRNGTRGPASGSQGPQSS